MGYISHFMHHPYNSSIQCYRLTYDADYRERRGCQDIKKPRSKQYINHTDISLRGLANHICRSRCRCNSRTHALSVTTILRIIEIRQYSRCLCYRCIPCIGTSFGYCTDICYSEYHWIPRCNLPCK